MTKVYPKACPPPPPALPTPNCNNNPKPNPNPVVLTVWRKSLLFNCKGFTVYDSKGNLVFRVDNYIAGRKAEMVLMDASGTSLLTIRRKRLSLADNWEVYDGETTQNPRFSVRKCLNFLGTNSSLAQVISSKKKEVMYSIEGSYAQRCCSVYDDKRRRVAEMKRKEAAGGVVLGSDVFQLIVDDDQMDTTVAMTLVVLLDQMFASPSSISSLRASLLH